MDNMDSNKFSPSKTYQATDNNDEPYPSLSDYHDYEPNLEFDDSELHQGPDILASTADLLNVESNGIGSPESDFGEDNFEDLADNLESMTFCSNSYPEVGEEAIEEFAEISKYGIIDVKGDDSLGRKIIVLYACKLPAIKEIDHGHFLNYLKKTLENYVQQDYSLVYFHYGLSSKNKPSLGWLVQAYKAFDRNYKKNLKALYLVHPTSFLKFVSQLFRPLISAKFGRKLNYINSLKELDEHIKINILDIPHEVIEYDQKTNSPLPAEPPKPVETYLPTQQFGVSLQYIKTNYNVSIPPVVKQCVEFLDHPDALETEGLFRRSANAIKVNTLKANANKGENLAFEDPHEAAALLKKFLRELKEPLLTYEVYDEIIDFQSWSKEEQLRLVSILVMEKLPEDNYKLLKYVISFLSRVMERSDLNKMNAQNLAVVFGPNLVWSELVSMSLAAIGPINTFTAFLLIHHNEIFMI
ncbi:unnamed protein product [Brassicogethes aeneus]|uniref:Rho GTPase-activating protein 1 n=1 Tax=Brassicogethes aeneus TaxID=1431903 RepID=A0A9P0AS08_BRAAE|nr:unnamed protein product [Brassicogethes aeneus]